MQIRYHLGSPQGLKQAFKTSKFKHSIANSPCPQMPYHKPSSARSPRGLTLVLPRGVVTLYAWKFPEKFILLFFCTVWTEQNIQGEIWKFLKTGVSVFGIITWRFNWCPGIIMVMTVSDSVTPGSVIIFIIIITLSLWQHHWCLIMRWGIKTCCFMQWANHLIRLIGLPPLSSSWQLNWAWWKSRLPQSWCIRLYQCLSISASFWWFPQPVTIATPGGIAALPCTLPNILRFWRILTFLVPVHVQYFDVSFKLTHFATIHKV